MSAHPWRTTALAVLGAALLGGCAGDERALEPERDPVGGDLFARYIAVGNSITAGFQSLGINDSTQRQSYAYLIAQQARAPFSLPLLTRPGCPPPMSAPFSTTTIAGTPTWRAKRMCSRVCGIGPSAADTTRIAPSICAAPVIMFFT